MNILTIVLALSLQDPPKEKEEASLKVPLVEKATAGGQIRLRGEYRDPMDYASAATVDAADEIVLLRARVHLDLEIRKDLRAFLQLQDSRAFGEEGTVQTDLESTDLHQAWMKVTELGGVPLALQAGRMEVPTLGDGRLMSPLDWNNVGRTWDGATATFTPQDIWVQALAVIVREDPSGTLNADQYFYGLYGSWRGIEKFEFDGYLFARDLRNDPATGEDGVTGDVEDFTFGVRVKGGASGVEFTGEAAIQSGDRATDRVRALAAAVTLGYTFDHAWKPRIFAEATRASGDGDATDGRDGTFDPLFPFAHFYHGFIDLVGWRNVRTLMLSARAQPLEWLTLQVDGHAFRLDRDVDAWYSPAGAMRADGTGAAGKDVGMELDVHAKIPWNERVDVWLGWSHFRAGEFVEKTGRSPDSNWMFLQATVKF